MPVNKILKQKKLNNLCVTTLLKVKHCKDLKTKFILKNRIQKNLHSSVCVMYAECRGVAFTRLMLPSKVKYLNAATISLYRAVAPPRCFSCEAVACRRARHTPPQQLVPATKNSRYNRRYILLK